MREQETIAVMNESLDDAEMTALDCLETRLQYADEFISRGVKTVKVFA